MCEKKLGAVSPPLSRASFPTPCVLFFFNVFWGGGLRKEQIEEKDDEKAKKKISDENYVLFARK